MAATFEYPEHVCFECNLCARCCGDTKDTVRHVLLLKSDADRISNETSLDCHKFAHEVFGFEPYILEMKKTKEDGKCYFLKNGRCTIYNIRPLICRFYPFELKNLNDNKYVFSYTNKCEGIGKGSELKREFFENLFSRCANAMEENSKTNKN